MIKNMHVFHIGSIVNQYSQIVILPFRKFDFLKSRECLHQPARDDKLKLRLPRRNTFVITKKTTQKPLSPTFDNTL